MGDTQVMQTPETRSFKEIEQMPALIAAGFVPASAAQIMEGRIDGWLSYEEHYISGDALIFHPDGDVKLVWDSEWLHNLKPESPIYGGNLLLPNYAWNSIGGEVISKSKVARYSGRDYLSKRAVKGNPFWQWLARHDKDLLNNYIDHMFDLAPSDGNSDGMMGVYVGRSNTDEEVAHRFELDEVVLLMLHPWGLSGVDHGGSCADCLMGASYYGGRLLGIEPEAPSVKKGGNHVEQSRPSLDRVLAAAENYVPDGRREDFRAEMKKLYK